MGFEIEKLDLEGMLLIHAHVANDNRGFYRKNFERNIFAENGLDFSVTEWSDIYSHKGAIRGLHFQTGESQAKLLHVIKGAIYDVAVDLRRDSSTFGKWHGETLRENDHKGLYIPEGFAHGFLVLSDEAEFCYKCTDFYHPGDEGGLAWNDPEIGIEWPELTGEYHGTASGEGYALTDGTKLNLSEKDVLWKGLKDTFRFE